MKGFLTGEGKILYEKSVTAYLAASPKEQKKMIRKIKKYMADNSLLPPNYTYIKHIYNRVGQIFLDNYDK